MAVHVFSSCLIIYIHILLMLFTLLLSHQPHTLQRSHKNLSNQRLPVFINTKENEIKMYLFNDSASFYDISTRFRNCSDTVVFFGFNLFIIRSYAPHCEAWYNHSKTPSASYCLYLSVLPRYHNKNNHFDQENINIWYSIQPMGMNKLDALVTIMYV